MRRRCSNRACRQLRCQLSFLSVAMIAVGCSDPTSPAGTSVAGTWTGESALTQCQSNCQPSGCRFILGATRVITPRLVQDGSRVVAFLPYLDEDPFFTYVGRLRGELRPGGTLEVRGAFNQVDRTTNTVNLHIDTTWSMTLDSAGTTLSGIAVSVSYSTRGPQPSCRTTTAAILSGLVRTSAD
jgi:hypothetical protein